MYFLTGDLITQGLEMFKSMQIEGPESGDQFFGMFGPGNMANYADRPFERFSDYEDLLRLLRNDDPQKYKEIHKGTPFYYLSWTAFDMKNYEKALFYMDAAISEDIRKDPHGWLDNPAGSFLTLGLPIIQAASRVAPFLRSLVEAQLTRFNSTSGRQMITVDNFIDRFVRVLVRDTPKRSIITAFYTFLLEFEDRCVDLDLRSAFGGSIEPFLTHLFKGGLIFESLLKDLYPRDDNDQPVKTLAEIFKTTNFKNDFQITVQTSSSSLENILKKIQTGSLQSAFNATSRIRNTTGHNLVWNDVFASKNNYRALFEQQVNAIFYIVAVKFP